MRDTDGHYQDPRLTQRDLAVIYFHFDGKTLPQFVCRSVEAQIKLDIIMSGLMTVLVVETRKASVIRKLRAFSA